MLDGMGRYKTQSLFLEFGYDADALFTLKDQDHIYEGKLYVSMKRLYLEMEDPTEYQFANTVLVNWKHWQKMTANKMIRQHVDEWRSELEYKLRAQGVQAMIQQGRTGSYQAAKWLADRGWDVRPAGRPSKEEIQREKEFQSRVTDEYGADVIRLLKNSG